ncbi:5-(carboxyamino)imidazole ribonucleotide mutase [Pseudobacteriovorax antillogorgiicola]|uniref:N5-carboxyaminoimidazole ribonucleotide mutase n=1 Tax=Pseudobacteriovorax antillogorgiicola TaxID=1513793 RepID=A0A1Y6CJQ4_9BACT|nr:5-(carboxyamino)imidazole ribonucleotide mutase [Pseudobacteriovorax antillogorgiicola]TCS47696.1 5-(carboxyamino)imidazole ribonucleotide mutase [Pseudobacteriovorax antillogorgiicola]SMF59452.1 5-(carboxyamino)imidazole ribonucleotide mutase [Pseudobacteriovorax antillogorgiicola]
MTSPSSPKPRVAIIMGSDSDFPVMRQAADALSSLDIAFELKVVSAHRTPQEMAQFAEGARSRGIQVIIAGAGGAAHLPGMVAAHTPLPVIGVPVPIGYKQGEDALWSIVQMPKGVPVATVAIGGAYNAGLLAAQICGFGGAECDQALGDKLQQLKAEMREASLAKVVSYPENS